MQFLHSVSPRCQLPQVTQAMLDTTNVRFIGPPWSSYIQCHTSTAMQCAPCDQCRTSSVVRFIRQWLLRRGLWRARACLAPRFCRIAAVPHARGGGRARGGVCVAHAVVFASRFTGLDVLMKTEFDHACLESAPPEGGSYYACLPTGFCLFCLGGGTCARTRAFGRQGDHLHARSAARSAARDLLGIQTQRAPKCRPVPARPRPSHPAAQQFMHVRVVLECNQFDEWTPYVPAQYLGILGIVQCKNDARE